MDQLEDKRTFHALRTHIDELLTAGAVITSRNPVTIHSAGETMKVRHGMLVGYLDRLNRLPPVADHD